jgi:hypothetical protein
MRAILRVGIVVGAGGFIALFALQRTAALAAVLGILAAGVVTGLGAAKWLEWAWYGKQIEAGLKTGAIACGLSGCGTLLSLFIVGPRSTASLAAESHLLGVDFSPLVHGADLLGWIGTDAIVVVVASAAGAILATFVTLLFAFGKSAHAVDAITRARQAAQAINRTEPLGAPMPSYPFGAAPNSGALWHSTPLPHILPPPGATPVPPSGSYASAPVTPPPGQPAPNSGRASSTARPIERELDPDEREALTKWAQEHAADSSGGGARPPQASAYLNSKTPAPKRSRKKQQTRDWLC